MVYILFFFSVVVLSASLAKVLHSWVSCAFGNVRGVPKKVTYRIMLESRCTTGSNTSSRHPLGMENVFLVVST